MLGHKISVAAAIALIVLLTGIAHATQTLKWDNLAPPWDNKRNPVEQLAKEQQDDVYTLLWGPNYGDPNGKRNAEEQKAYDSLKASGIDPDSLFAAIEKLREESIKRDQVLLFELDKEVIKLPGYVLPLDFDGTAVKSFLLVPYVGACIHTPPPPPNQIVYVEMAKAYESEKLFEPVWVTGRITVGMDKKSLTLVDGSDDVDVGYSLQATKIEPYKN